MTLSAPAMLLTAAVTLLAVLISIFFAINVARNRRVTGIDAPAMTGDPRLERALRIQGNTLEQFVVFVPSLWLAAIYFQGWAPPILGLVLRLWHAQATLPRLCAHHLLDPDPGDPGHHRDCAGVDGERLA
jgi:uncharacterized membrane protein YecN with MAPEG domain